MIIEYNDLRILDRNLIAYNVGKVEDDYEVNGKRKIRYSIFFNFINGYRELISFKTKKSADILCKVIDAFMNESGLRYSMNDGKMFCFFSKKTGYNIIAPFGNLPSGEDIDNCVVVYEKDIDENFIELDLWVTLFGLDNEVI